MKLGARIKQLRQEKGLTQSQLGSCFNLAESTISLYESEKRSPDYDILRKFALFFDVSVDYLLGFANERRPLRIEETREEYSPDARPALKPVQLPVLNRVTFGSYGLTYEKSAEEEWAVYDNSREVNHYWLRVEDNSMIGDGILPQDLVLIREQPRVEYGDIGLVLINGQAASIHRIFKKESSIVLHSSNPTYPPRIFTGKNLSNIRVVGKVIEVRRKL